MKSMGLLLYDAREAVGMTLEEASEGICRTRSYLQYEREARVPPASIAHHLCKRLRIENRAELFTAMSFLRRVHRAYNQATRTETGYFKARNLCLEWYDYENLWSNKLDYLLFAEQMHRAGLGFVAYMRPDVNATAEDAQLNSHQREALRLINGGPYKLKWDVYLKWPSWAGKAPLAWVEQRDAFLAEAK